MRQECGYFLFSHLNRMAFVVKEDKVPHPSKVGLLAQPFHVGHLFNLMRSRKTRASLLALAAATLIAWPESSVSAARDKVNLHRVRKIFLQTERNFEMNEQANAGLKRLHAALTATLATFGFTVVNNLADADAVMDGDTGEWITLDGPQPDPPKYRFHFWLASSKQNVRWQTEFNISSRATESEVERRAMQKVAHNLFKAWKKSATKAGIAVGDRLPG